MEEKMKSRELAFKVLKILMPVESRLAMMKPKDIANWVNKALSDEEVGQEVNSAYMGRILRDAGIKYLAPNPRGQGRKDPRSALECFAGIEKRCDCLQAKVDAVTKDNRYLAVAIKHILTNLGENVPHAIEDLARGT